MFLIEIKRQKVYRISKIIKLLKKKLKISNFLIDSDIMRD